MTIVEAERGIWEINDYLAYVNGEIVTVLGAGSGTGVGVVHSLGRVPEFFQVVSQDADGSLWRDPDDRWTTASVTFQGESGTTFKVRIW